MKFVYKYRTSDNALHEGLVSAGDRDAAFDLLKSRGIKPFGIEVAPGFCNKLFGRGKRWMAIVALAIAAVVGWLSVAKTTMQIRESERHQLYGDPALMEEMVASGYSSVFENQGECYLAYYAQPGAETDAAPTIQPDVLKDALQHRIEFLTKDRREERELKAIVNGMKEELRRYLSDGVGTFASYMGRLEERQALERAIYNRVAAEVRESKDDAVRIEKNRELSAVGLRTILMRDMPKNAALKNF